jgi:hypothetical protein
VFLGKSAILGIEVTGFFVRLLKFVEFLGGPKFLQEAGAALA